MFTRDSFSTDSFDTNSFLFDVGIAVVGGGIGHGGKRRKIYVEKDGNIYLFDNASDAAAWIEYQKELEKPVEQQKLKKKVPKPEVIKVSELKEKVVRYQTEHNLYDLERFMLSNDWDMLLNLQRLLEMKEDDELIILLLAI